MFTKLFDCSSTYYLQRQKIQHTHFNFVLRQLLFFLNKQKKQTKNQKPKPQRLPFVVEEDTGQIPFLKLRLLFLFPGCPENSLTEKLVTGTGRTLSSADRVRGHRAALQQEQGSESLPMHTAQCCHCCGVPELSWPCRCPWVFPFQFQSWLLTVICSSANYNRRYNSGIQKIKISQCMKTVSKQLYC